LTKKFIGGPTRKLTKAEISLKPKPEIDIDLH